MGPNHDGRRLLRCAVLVLATISPAVLGRPALAQPSETMHSGCTDVGTRFDVGVNKYNLRAGGICRLIFRNVNSYSTPTPARIVSVSVLQRPKQGILGLSDNGFSGAYKADPSATGMDSFVVRKVLCCENGRNFEKDDAYYMYFQ